MLIKNFTTKTGRVVLGIGSVYAFIPGLIGNLTLITEGWNNDSDENR